MPSSVPDGELSGGILASLGQLLTSSANNLGELLRMMPSVSRLSHSVTATSDSPAVKRRRMSHKPSSTAAHTQLSEDESSATQTINNVTHHQPPLSPCFTGLYYCSLTQSLTLHSHCHKYKSGYPCVVQRHLYIDLLNTNLHVFQWQSFTSLRVLH